MLLHQLLNDVHSLSLLVGGAVGATLKVIVNAPAWAMVHR